MRISDWSSDVCSSDLVWSYNLRELGRYYRRYWELMKHWRSEFPDAMLEIRYEDNVADVEGQAKKLIAYLGLEWHEGCLDFYNTDRPVRKASASQVRKPIYTTRTEKHTSELPTLMRILYAVLFSNKTTLIIGY